MIDLRKYISTKTNAVFKTMKTLKSGSKIELNETKEMFSLLIKNKKLTKEERLFVEEQATDMLKIVVSGGVLALPGGVPAFILLQKISQKYGIEITPSGFQDKKEITKITD